MTPDLESTRTDLIAMRGMVHLTTDCSKAPIGQASERRTQHASS